MNPISIIILTIGLFAYASSSQASSCGTMGTLSDRILNCKLKDDKNQFAPRGYDLVEFTEWNHSRTYRVANLLWTGVDVPQNVTAEGAQRICSEFHLESPETFGEVQDFRLPLYEEAAQLAQLTNDRLSDLEFMLGDRPEAHEIVTDEIRATRFAPPYARSVRCVSVVHESNPVTRPNACGMGFSSIQNKIDDCRAKNSSPNAELYGWKLVEFYDGQDVWMSPDGAMIFSGSQLLPELAPENRYEYADQLCASMTREWSGVKTPRNLSFHQATAEDYRTARNARGWKVLLFSHHTHLCLDGSSMPECGGLTPGTGAIHSTFGPFRVRCAAPL